MSGSGQMESGFLGTLLASIGIPLILKALTGSGLHNKLVGGFKDHRKKIPIPQNSQPVVKQPEGTALVNKTLEPYNPPPFYDEQDIRDVKGYGLKTKNQKNEKE